MARKKGSNRSEEEKRRLAAIHAKNGDRSQQATRAAKARWEKEYAEYPRYSLADLAEVQAKRDAAARERDNKSTSTSVIDPRSDRIHLWVKDPAHHDAKGIDTEIEPDQKPERPPRPSKKAPRHGDGKPKHAPNPKPDDEAPKAPEKDGAEPPAEAPEPPKPASKGKAAKTKSNADEPKKAKAKKQREPPENPEATKMRNPPDPKASKVEGFSMDAYVHARRAWDEHVKHTHSRAKPPEFQKPKEAHERLLRMIFGKKPTAKKDRTAWEWDLSKGGAVMDDENVMAVFDPSAPNLGSSAQGTAAAATDSRVQGVYDWKKARDQDFFIDLGAYLKALDAPANVNVIPIGGSLYDKKRVEAIAKALPGDVLVSSAENEVMAIRQGDRGVLLGPLLDSDDPELYPLPFLERYVAHAGRSKNPS